jgi:type I restriction enzyme M protein
LRNFEIIAIVELGSGTFMATGTNTVTLFLRKRNKFFVQNLEFGVNKFFTDLKDITLNGTQKLLSKYVNEVWE